MCVRVCACLLSCVCARKRRANKTGEALKRKIEQKIGDQKQKEEGERDKYTLPLCLLVLAAKTRERKGSEEEEQKEEEEEEDEAEDIEEEAREKKKKTISQALNRWTHFVAFRSVLLPLCLFFF